MEAWDLVSTSLRLHQPIYKTMKQIKVATTSTQEPLKLLALL
jgi:hypothetical protein